MTPHAAIIDTTDDIDLPQLKPGLPEDIAWLENDLRALVRPAAFLRSQSATRDQAPLGGTRAWGSGPDVPVDAPWAPAHELQSLQRQWAESPYDGPSFTMQLNLEEIPASVRASMASHCPAVGIVWIFIDLTDNWKGIAHFDPRPTSSITWHPPGAPALSVAAQWTLADTLPFATEETIPAIAANWDNLGEMYDDWIQDHYRAPSDIQIGGWTAPIQGDHDEAQKTFVCALTQRSFGDSGAVYLHYNSESGQFFVLVETC